MSDKFILTGVALPLSMQAPPSSDGIPSDTFYGSMEREALTSLPGVNSGCKTFTSPEMEESYIKVYAGDFIMIWQVNVEDDQVVLLLIASQNVEEEASPEILIAVDFIVYSSQVCRVEVGIRESADERPLHLFCERLTVDQKDSLVNRMLHIFVRTHGAQHHALSQGIVDYLRCEYSKLHYWKENEDACKIGADIAFKNTSCDCQNCKNVIERLVQVGDALAANGRFHDAGTLYEEISSRFFGEYPQTDYDQQFLTVLAAVSYERAETFEDAERLYVCSIHHTLALTGGSWAGTEPRTQEIFANTVSMYILWQKKECRDKGTTQADASHEVALGALAFYAGIGSDCIQAYKEYGCMLKAKYKRKKLAQKTLADAVDDSPVSVVKFRKTLAECLNSNKLARRMHTTGLTRSSSDRRRSSKQNARETVSNVSQTLSQFAEECHNPGCRNAENPSKIMFCPCQTVGYCSKECQRDDWKKRHKRVCPVQKQASL